MKLRFNNVMPENADADLVVIGFCEEERPLRGAAGMVDWRLDGFLSRTMIKHHIVGEAGEVSIVPSCDRFKARWIVIVGLGSSLALSDTQVLGFGETAIEKSHEMKCNTCAVYYPQMFMKAPYRRQALKLLLNGISKGASTIADPEYLDQLTLCIPSRRDEELDLADAQMTALLADHSPAQRLSELE